VTNTKELDTTYSNVLFGDNAFKTTRIWLCWFSNSFDVCSCFVVLQIGFEMIDVFAESVGIQMNLVNFKAIMGQGMSVTW